MGCVTCKGKLRINDEYGKMRALAARIAEEEGRTQIIVRKEGRLWIDCLECFRKAGETGKIIEYFVD
jgi:hypothetical protein